MVQNLPIILFEISFFSLTILKVMLITPIILLIFTHYINNNDVNTILEIQTLG